MKRLLFFVSLLTAVHTYAQIAPYKFRSDIDSVIRNDTLPYRYQLAASDLSFIGAYPYTLKVRDMEFKSGTGEPSQQRKDLLKNYTPVNADEYILQQAAKARVVIFNEAHHQPMHRAYVSSLLPKLKALGYTFIGMEVLDNKDSSLSARKYPVINTGYYSKEPGFGNLIRNAFALGYTVFPYEADADAQKRGENRDALQARNIKAVIDQHPNTKFIIYCGYDHAIEDSTHNFMVLPMAGVLKQVYGIDPFTVDQVQLTESSTKGYGNTYRKLIDLNYDAVFIDSNGQHFNKAKNNSATFDCNIYHPDTKYINGRPAWLSTADKKAIDIRPQITIAYPCMVKAYLVTDDTSQAVPIDIIELENDKDPQHLIINKKGKHMIVINNKADQQQVLRLK